MFKINGKEYGFYYSVWAHCELNDWIVKNPERSYASAIVQKAVIMSKAYVKAHGGAALKPQDLCRSSGLCFHRARSSPHGAGKERQ